MLPILFLLFVLVFSSCRTDQQEEGGEKENLSNSTGGRSAEQTIVFEEPDLPQPQEAKIDVQEKAPECDTESVPTIPRPKVAIIIDDMGYHQQVGSRLLALDLNLTFSFLPNAPFTLEQEEQAWEKGRDILLHMPMEAQDPTWDPGPGGLYLRFSAEEIRTKVAENLIAVPHAIGSNNHMGSKFTENREAMHEVLSVLKKRELFFIDSYTTSRSTGLDEAGKMSIPTARRHVFLDNAQDQDKICHQLERLIALAKKQGWAIGIGHPNQATLKALTSCKKHLLESVDVVGVHALVNEHLN